MEKTTLVITSIASPNKALQAFAELCQKKRMEFIVIGDTKSPAEFELEGCDFWSIERQKSIQNSFVELVPFKHYARKNIGYLLAKENGAEVIIETDDDNLPYENFLDFFPAQAKIKQATSEKWLNIYSLFSDSRIWPRGLSLEHILSDNKVRVSDEALVNCPIQQGLADENPDVDALFRLTYSLPVNFKKNLTFALERNAWCPFNSQNTVWYKEAFMLAYLPSYCSFRMTDIWRSFVAQRIAWENNWNILFYSPTVWQERNEHNLLKDFEDEISGYLNNDKIADALQDLSLKQGKIHMADNMLKCYDKLIEMGLVGEKEMPLLQEWIKQF